ncbi:hypothetical protein GGQ97_001825 [Sphingomonas kaistensis]|uniref:CsbD family protein n=1 Tax=Sphingomonas kaistensis TaxID=298708 RepID=A0A7X5Y7N0_9SPHN|nr:hypothetical protein [Sphingomonas kaistensis]NJC06032.1 hypothetical protein [Sphingomonas kaistensis]
MADTTNKLPEGTDTVIEAGGAGGTTGSAGRSGTAIGNTATGGRTSATAGDSQTDALITGTTTGDDDGSASNGGIRGMVSNVTGKAKDEALGRARGFVGEGLKSGSTTLGSIANIIEDTVEQIGERLGPQYGDYAKSASSTIQRYASTLESKDPDELVDDARALIRKSPAVAITGAAILGFGLVRLLKAGMPEGSSNEARDRQGDRAGTTR